MISSAVHPPHQTAAGQSEDLTFHRSAECTLGVELELMVLDRATGDLAPGAMRILQACADASVDGVSAELVQTMLEVKTGVCRNVDEVRNQLVPLLKRVRNVARSLGFELAMSGTHPFHRAVNSALSPSPRYGRIFDRLAYLVQQRVVFGLHVHVGVGDGDLAIGIINRMAQYLPHLVGIAANSPFWEGIDSGLASCRTALFGTLPHAGVPRYFRHWKDFCSFFQVMSRCGAISSTKDIYWDIRPRPGTGTIEFRICDMPASLADVYGIAAFLQALVTSTQRRLAEKPRAPRADIRRNWIAVENKWLATRHGLSAPYIRNAQGKQRPLGEDLADLLERLAPVARESNNEPYLAHLTPQRKSESGADRQRRLYRETANWLPLINDMIQRLSQALDGNVEQGSQSSAQRDPLPETYNNAAGPASDVGRTSIGGLIETVGGQPSSPGGIS